MKAKVAKTKLLDLTGSVERRVLRGIACDISANQTLVSDNSTVPLGAVQVTACMSGSATLIERPRDVSYASTRQRGRESDLFVCLRGITAFAQRMFAF